MKCFLFMSLFNQLGKTQLGDINTPMKTSHLKVKVRFVNNLTVLGAKVVDFLMYSFNCYLSKTRRHPKAFTRDMFVYERITCMFNSNGKLNSVCNRCVQERRRCSVKE